jgi:hypothetical protein
MSRYGITFNRRGRRVAEFKFELDAADGFFSVFQAAIEKVSAKNSDRASVGRASATESTVRSTSSDR